MPRGTKSLILETFTIDAGTQSKVSIKTRPPYQRSMIVEQQLAVMCDMRKVHALPFDQQTQPWPERMRFISL